MLSVSSLDVDDPLPLLNLDLRKDTINQWNIIINIMDDKISNYHIRESLFKKGIIPPEDSLSFSDYIKYKYDNESKDSPPLKSLNDIIREGDIDSFQYYLKQGFSPNTKVATNILIFALQKKQYSFANFLLNQKLNFELNPDLCGLILSSKVESLIIRIEKINQLPKEIRVPYQDEKKETPDNIQDYKSPSMRMDIISYLLLDPSQKNIQIASRMLKLSSYQLPKSEDEKEKLKHRVLEVGDKDIIQLLKNKGLDIDSPKLTLR